MVCTVYLSPSFFLYLFFSLHFKWIPLYTIWLCLAFSLNMSLLSTFRVLRQYRYCDYEYFQCVILLFVFLINCLDFSLFLFPLPASFGLSIWLWFYLSPLMAYFPYTFLFVFLGVALQQPLKHTFMLLQSALHNNFNIVYISTAVYVHFFSFFVLLSYSLLLYVL